MFEYEWHSNTSRAFIMYEGMIHTFFQKQTNIDKKMFRKLDDTIRKYAHISITT